MVIMYRGLAEKHAGLVESLVATMSLTDEERQAIRRNLDRHWRRYHQGQAINFETEDCVQELLLRLSRQGHFGDDDLVDWTTFNEPVGNKIALLTRSLNNVHLDLLAQERGIQYKVPLPDDVDLNPIPEPRNGVKELGDIAAERIRTRVRSLAGVVTDASCCGLSFDLIPEDAENLETMRTELPRLRPKEFSKEALRMRAESDPARLARAAQLNYVRASLDLVNPLPSVGATVECVDPSSFSACRTVLRAAWRSIDTLGPPSICDELKLATKVLDVIAYQGSQTSQAWWTKNKSAFLSALRAHFPNDPALHTVAGCLVDPLLQYEMFALGA